MATRKKAAPKSKPKKTQAKTKPKPKPLAAKKKTAPKKKSAPAKKKPALAKKPLAVPARMKVQAVKERMARSLGVVASPPPPPEPDTTAPTAARAIAAPAPRPRRVSIGEALAQLNAAALEGVTRDLEPFGLNADAPLTPSPGLASLLGFEPRPLSDLVHALEAWDGEGADLNLINEARGLLDSSPRIAEDLEAFIRRNSSS